MIISQHHGFMIQALPSKWARAKAKGFNLLVTGHGSTLFATDINDARNVVAQELEHYRYWHRPHGRNVAKPLHLSTSVNVSSHLARAAKRCRITIG